MHLLGILCAVDTHSIHAPPTHSTQVTVTARREWESILALGDERVLQSNSIVCGKMASPCSHQESAAHLVGKEGDGFGIKRKSYGYTCYDYPTNYPLRRARAIRRPTSQGNHAPLLNQYTITKIHRINFHLPLVNVVKITRARRRHVPL